MRKVRAPQGRTPDNVRWRRLQGKCNRNRPQSNLQGWKGEVRAHRRRGNAARRVNPVRCKIGCVPHRAARPARTVNIARTLRRRCVQIDDRTRQNSAYRSSSERMLKTPAGFFLRALCLRLGGLIGNFRLRRKFRGVRRSEAGRLRLCPTQGEKDRRRANPLRSTPRPFCRGGTDRFCA